MSAHLFCNWPTLIAIYTLTSTLTTYVSSDNDDGNDENQLDHKANDMIMTSIRMLLITVNTMTSDLGSYRENDGYDDGNDDNGEDDKHDC